MMDDGYKLIVDKKYRWHSTHRNDDHFTEKLNLSNAVLLQASLNKLVSPKKKRKKYEESSVENEKPIEDSISETVSDIESSHHDSLAELTASKSSLAELNSA